MDREDFRSSTELTISTPVIHNLASVGKFEQEHTSVLNLIFQHENFCGGGQLQNEVLET